MNYFTYKEIYEKNSKKILEVNILPQKCCNFDCIFCPLERSKCKTDKQQEFGAVEDSLNELQNKNITEIIDFIKSQNLNIRLLSNGYLLGENKYMNIANMSSFKKQYKGLFILEVTILKGYNDNDISINKLKKAIDIINPDRLIIKREEDKRFEKRLGISQAKLEEIQKKCKEVIS